MAAPAALEGFALCSAQSRLAGPAAMAESLPSLPCHHHRHHATTIVTVPLPSSLCHRRHHRAAAIITVPPPSVPCHCHPHHATAVIAVSLPSSWCHCRHGRATIVIAMPLSSLLCHSHHRRATIVITVPLSSSLCHYRHRCATAVILVPPPPLPAGDWALAASTGKAGWLWLPPMPTSIAGRGSILGTWQKAAEPRGAWVGGGCQHPAGAWVVPLLVQPRDAHGSPGCGQCGSVILLSFLESRLLSSSPERKKSSSSICSIPWASMQGALLAAAAQSISVRAFPARVGGLGGALLPKRKIHL